MIAPSRLLALAVLSVLPLAPAARGVDLDRSAVDFKTPTEIKWVRNAAGTNESAVLFGDPSQPGPYVVGTVLPAIEPADPTQTPSRGVSGTGGARRDLDPARPCPPAGS